MCRPPLLSSSKRFDTYSALNARRNNSVGVLFISHETFYCLLNEFYHEFGLFGHPDKPDELGIYAGHVRDC
jgi:hypothetical protein